VLRVCAWSFRAIELSRNTRPLYRLFSRQDWARETEQKAGQFRSFREWTNAVHFRQALRAAAFDVPLEICQRLRFIVHAIQLAQSRLGRPFCSASSQSAQTAAL
jgi:hypothetical protein